MSILVYDSVKIVIVRSSFLSGSMERLNFASGIIVIFLLLKICVDEAIEFRIIVGIIVNVFSSFFFPPFLEMGR